MDNDERYRAIIVHLALQLARARHGNVSGEEILEHAKEILRHAYELGGLPMPASIAS